MSTTMPDPVYLDHAATTPLRPEALAAMRPFLGADFANPSSVYRPAQRVRAAVDSARDTIADVLSVRSTDLVLTSGGTEADNAAVKGVAFASHGRGRHLVTTAIEHHAVLHPMEELAERFGFELTVVPPDPNGLVNPDAVEAAVRGDTVLISVMWANNEIGTIQPVERIGAMARDCGIPFHVDAVQAAGWLPIALQAPAIDLLTLSAHKFYGPKGAGVLYVRTGTPWWPLVVGGAQERNRRAGTENVAAIVGMAEALRLAERERPEAASRVANLRDRLLDGLRARVPGLVVHGSMRQRLANNLNISVPGLSGESMVMSLDRDNILVSSGAACTSGSTEPSHVLTSLGLDDDLASGSVRFSLGRENTAEQIDRAVESVVRVVDRARAATVR